MGKQRSASSQAGGVDAGAGAHHDHGDTRSDWPASPSWVPPTSACSGGGADAAKDEFLARNYPTLHEWLTLCGLGGTQRKTGTILVFAEEGKWKACTNDRDGGFYAFTSADSLEGLLGALERGLKGGGLDWRKSKGRK